MGSYARGYTKWDFTNYFTKAAIGAVRGSGSRGSRGSSKGSRGSSRGSSRAVRVAVGQ